MQATVAERSRSDEEQIELAGKLTQEFLNSGLLRALIERERQINRQIGNGGPGPGPGPTGRKAPKWAHDLLDYLWGGRD